jgi:hypothetical protein
MATEVAREQSILLEVVSCPRSRTATTSPARSMDNEPQPDAFLIIEMDWFVLREGRYEKLPVGTDGILRSTVFPGLWLDPTALLKGDLAMVLAVLQRGIQSPEHAEFVARLARARGGTSDRGQGRPDAP